MHLIRAPLAEAAGGLPIVRIPVERMVLAKRRWRGVAEDGREFGFDLEQPLHDGAVIHQGDGGLYCIAQKYESVLEVRTSESGFGTVADAARLGWMIGNLHFQIEMAGEVIRVADDPALRQLFERERIPFVICQRVFHPLSGGHRH